jgi:hypothetical protein
MKFSCTGCTFQDNTADYGSAIMASREDDRVLVGAIKPGAPLSLSLSGSTFSGSRRWGKGGAWS